MSNGWWGLFWTGIIVAALVSMIGCTTRPTLPNVPDVVITEAKLAVPVKCPVIVPGTPDWVYNKESRAMAANVWEVAKLADVGIFERDRHIEDLLDLLRTCVK